MAARHIFVEGAVNGIPVSFILDTGSRHSIIGSSVARDASMYPSGKGPGNVMGLDGNAVEVNPVTAERLRLGELTVRDVAFLSADLEVFEGMGLRGGAGLIGNDFLDDFDRVEIDFDRGVLTLWD
jgi:predicted aspartyl protease